MRLLRAALRWHASLWALLGLVLLVAPGWVVERLLDQPPVGEDAWLRLAGGSSIALAAQMVLVGHRIEELWWWAWTFVFASASAAIVCAITAVTGRPEGAAAWPWWLLASATAALAAVEVVALARSGTERSPV